MPIARMRPSRTLRPWGAILLTKPAEPPVGSRGAREAVSAAEAGPFTGSGPAIAAVLGGHVPIAFTALTPALPQITSGKLRALAITSPRRSTIMPEVPTTTEAGFPALVADNWYALFAPAGTPAPILARLHEATVAALGLPEVRDKLSEQGAEVVGNSPAELAAYVAAEIPKWTALAREAGVKPE